MTRKHIPANLAARGTFTAAGLLERFDSPWVHEARSAAKMPPEQWAAFAKAKEERRNVKPGTHPSAARVMMQGLSVPLQLPTSHYPTLRATFPSLLGWIVSTLRHVADLDHRMQNMCSELDSAEARAATVNRLNYTTTQELRADIDNLNNEAAGLHARAVELSAQLAEADAANRVLHAQLAAANTAAQAALLALKIAANSTPHLADVVSDLEKVKPAKNLMIEEGT